MQRVVGLLMATHDIEDEAAALLRSTSSHFNIELAEVARVWFGDRGL